MFTFRKAQAILKRKNNYNRMRNSLIYSYNKIFSLGMICLIELNTECKNKYNQDFQKS